jgi:mannonate dehydratase
MEISLRLEELTDEELSFVRQIGVERVDVHNPTLVPGYEEQGEEYFLNIPKVLRKIRKMGVDIASFRYPRIRNALLGNPEGKREVENLNRVIKTLGDNDAHLIQVDFHSVRLSPRGVPGRYETKQRGGYTMDAFSLGRMRKQMTNQEKDERYIHHFTDTISAEKYFDNCVKVYEEIVPELENSGVKLAIHTDDPPIPDEEGLLPGITTPEKIHKLFDAVPSPNSGLLFCTGTRYESGINIIQQIEQLGSKIFHVHFRNVKGTIPENGGYEEVMLDDGDMDMLEVLRALSNAGYAGALNPDHFPILSGDTHTRNAGRAFAVGYIRALLSAL